MSWVIEWLKTFSLPVYLDPIRNYMQKPIGELLLERFTESRGLFGFTESFRGALNYRGVNLHV
jgi:hypothetical protein